MVVIENSFHFLRIRSLFLGRSLKSEASRASLLRFSAASYGLTTPWFGRKLQN